MDRTQQAPLLTEAQRVEWERIQTRVARANATLRRARKRGDEVEIGKAKRAHERACEARARFCEPLTAGLYAPTRVRATFEHRWFSHPVVGQHVFVVEMVLDRRDISGPQYRTVRVISEVGAPPTGARSAPTCSGIAWFAVRDVISSGRYIVLDEVAS